MCVLAFAWRAHPRWSLVVAGNRDELHARPAQALGRWEQPDHIIAGRDLQSGGTWLGVSEQGRFVVVTNLHGHGGPEADRSSRGALVADLLAGEGRYSGSDEDALADFNPFNLIAVDRERARFFSNRPAIIRDLEAGVYGLSNGTLDEPWPRTMRLKTRLIDWMAAGSRPLDVLLDDLAEDRLPDAVMHSAAVAGVPDGPARAPIFIRQPVYGTRCSTVMAVDDRGEGLIVERRYDAAGAPSGETALTFSWPR